MSTIEERTLGAEIRAIEEGHRAFLRDGTISVVSDSTPGLHYNVTAAVVPVEGSGIIFRCNPNWTEWDKATWHRSLVSPIPGAVPCKHAALLARRFARNGLARWENGLWVATDKAVRLAREALGPVPDDPFEGL